MKILFKQKDIYLKSRYNLLSKTKIALLFGAFFLNLAKWNTCVVILAHMSSAGFALFNVPTYIIHNVCSSNIRSKYSSKLLLYLLRILLEQTLVTVTTFQRLVSATNRLLTLIGMSGPFIWVPLFPSVLVFCDIKLEVFQWKVKTFSFARKGKSLFPLFFPKTEAFQTIQFSSKTKG